MIQQPIDNKCAGLLLRYLLLSLCLFFFSVRALAAEVDDGGQAPAKITLNKVVIQSLSVDAAPAIAVSAVEAFANAELAKYQYQLTMDQLQALVNAVTRYYIDRGLLFNRAYLPPQEITANTLTLHILEGTLGAVHLLDEKAYSGEALTRPFAPLLDQPIVEAEISSALIRANDVPGLTIYSFFSKGERVGKTDLNLTVMEDFKHRFAMESDNYGAKTTGENRLTLSYDRYRPFTKRDQLSLGLTASDAADKNIFGSVVYRTQWLGYKNALESTVSSNEYTLGGSARSLRLEGRVNTISVKVERRWRRSDNDNLLSHIDYSFRDFTLDSALFDGAFDLEESVHKVTLGVARNGYDGAASSYGIGAYLGYGNPNVDSGYLRAVDGISDYWLARLSLSYRRDFFQRTRVQQLAWSLSSQYSDGELPSVDLFGLTGAHYVRAYDVGLASADKGVLSRLHWYFPAINGRAFGQSLAFKSFALLDYAYGASYLSDADGGESWTEIMGTGVGLHTHLGAHSRLQFTLAKPLHWKGALNPGVDKDHWRGFLKLHWALER
ncbi:MAG: hypothetical protein KTR20_00395 [Cellvibrionaceae bacterium]|nr:hypothetical protein [Cellvibrionaceae bacterium]